MDEAEKIYYDITQEKERAHITKRETKPPKKWKNAIFFLKLFDQKVKIYNKIIISHVTPRLFGQAAPLQKGCEEAPCLFRKASKRRRASSEKHVTQSVA